MVQTALGRQFYKKSACFWVFQGYFMGVLMRFWVCNTAYYTVIPCSTPKKHGGQTYTNAATVAEMVLFFPCSVLR